MSQRFTLFTGMSICLLFGFCLNALVVGADSPSTWATLEKAYAEANLQLAQARLAQARSENSAVAGSVSEDMLDELEAGVRLTKARLQQLKDGATSNTYAAQIAAGEEAVRGLEADHAASLKANSIEAGSVPQVKLAREAAELAVAKARLASLKDLVRQPAEVQVRWEIGQLQDQVRALWSRPLIED